ncbi:chemotaxis protein CheY [Pseudoalteromonas luteoviolacea]|uniref:Chemotaxis protein CheY n=1 Tax=Pseudoalteromonas luteoviolacea TaxID=43657 RepID=A0A0C1QBR0_9GAMM|nr:response regulator [Pseudoalteromonas luteoviolacea]KID58056.1 chemotaxis protein CheY [Pseudoalteromonas luteoviolacea]
MSTSILIIDDDQSLCELLTEYLEAEQFDVECKHDGEQGLHSALTNEYGVILLDVMMPQKDGFEVLKSLRLEKMTPVIMLTAKGDDFDRIFGLELGADDYIPKPFNHRELLARIKAITRRVAHLTQHNTPLSIEFHGLVLDMASRSASIHNHTIPLTGTEYEVLYQLMKSAGEIVSKQTLCQSVLGRPLVAYDRSVDMHVSNVRKKLAQHSEHTFIKTLRGSGYIFLTA